MNLTKAVGAAVFGAGAVVAVNSGLRHDEALEAPLDGRSRTFRWRGMDIHYAEAGDPEDDDLVLLHGINAAGSSGEWRELFSGLAEEYHVVAPDLPGFGLSDRPTLRYSAALYEDFVTDFLREFDEPAVVASSLSSAYAVAAATEVAVSRFLFVCPTTVAGPDPPKQWLRELLRAPVLGESVFNLLTSRPAIRYFNADHGYYDTSHVSDEWLDYEWQTTHAENARFAPASFVSGYLNSDVDLGADLASLDVPTTLVWGREAETTPLSTGRDLADEADCRLVVFDRARLLPHVEYPAPFLELVRQSSRPRVAL